VFAGFRNDSENLQPEFVTHALVFSGVKTRFPRNVARLQPDSCDFAQETHNRVVWKWVRLSCQQCRRWPLVLDATSGAIAVIASASDRRVSSTVSMPIGLYREVPLRLKRGPAEIERLLRALSRQAQVDSSKLCKRAAGSVRLIRRAQFWG
jgi:hypothetical protein